MSVLRAKIQTGRTIWTAGIYDALSAKIAEEVGFEAVMTGGLGVTASLLGLPDLELLSLSENVDVVSRITQAIAIPLIADIDTGYGDTINVWRSVRSFKAAGAQAVIIEDQITPKRCAACVDETSLVSIEEAVAKIKAAKDVAGNDLVVIARTDAFDPQEAFVRAKAYADAGADLIQPVSKTFSTYDELVELRRICNVPLSIQILGWLEELDHTAIERIAGLATFSLVALMTVSVALRENLSALRSTLSTKKLPHKQMALADFKDLIGFDQIIASHRKYTGA